MGRACDGRYKAMSSTMKNFKRMQIRAFEEATGWDRGILARGRQFTETKYLPPEKKGSISFHNNGTLRKVEYGRIYDLHRQSYRSLVCYFNKAGV